MEYFFIFLLQQMGTNRETYSQTLCREWELFSPKPDVFINYLPSSFMEYWRHQDKRKKEPEGLEDTKNTRNSKWEHNGPRHMNSQRLRQSLESQHVSVPGSFWKYFDYQYNIFVEFLSLWSSGLLFPFCLTWYFFLPFACFV